MNKSISKKITSIVVLIVFSSIALLGGANFYLSYHQIRDAAGAELTGCASITTGIIDANDLLAVIDQKADAVDRVNQQLEWTIDQKPIFEANYILSLDGVILASDSHLDDIGLKVGESVAISDNILEHLKAGHNASTAFYTVNGYERQTGYAPIYRDHNPKNEIIAINAIDFDAQLIRDRVWESNQATIIFTVLLPILAATVTFVFVRRTLLPIHAVKEQLLEMATGKLSSPPLMLEREDELGQLANGLNQMKTVLRDLIAQIQNMSEQTSENSQELLASSEQTQETIELIANSFTETNTLVNDQSTRTTEANNQLAEMAKHVQTMTKNIHTSAILAKKTVDLADVGKIVVEKTFNQFDKIHENTTEAKQISETLQQKSQEISQVMTLITHISQQTNLLALNASIEAARAQEQGAGFLVVAEAIRELSVQTNEAAQQVSSLIKELQTQALLSLNKSVDGQETVKQGVDLISQTIDAFQEISMTADSTAQQAHMLSDETEEIRKRTLLLVNEVESITTLAQKVTRNSQTTSEASQEQIKVMAEFVCVSRNLSQISDQLLASIQYFQIKQE